MGLNQFEDHYKATGTQLIVEEQIWEGRPSTWKISPVRGDGLWWGGFSTANQARYYGVFVLGARREDIFMPDKWLRCPHCNEPMMHDKPHRAC